MPDLAFHQWMLLAAITFAAGVVQSATGFGFAVISVPLFLLVLDSLTAIQINIVLNLFNALAVVPSLWRIAPHGLLKRLVAGTVIGLPLGMFAYLHADLTQVKVAIAILIIAFAVQLLIGIRTVRVAAPPSKSKSAWVIGGISGAMTSSLAMPGPPVLIYLSHFRLEKDSFRSTTLSLFVVSYACALVLQATFGAMTAQTWTLSAVLIPLAVIGALAGKAVSPWLSQVAFRVIVLATLLMTGMYMLYRAF